jgi:hypothetical protein
MGIFFAPPAVRLVDDAAPPDNFPGGNSPGAKELLRRRRSDRPAIAAVGTLGFAPGGLAAALFAGSLTTKRT